MMRERIQIPKNYIWPYLYFDINNSNFEYLRHFKVKNISFDDIIFLLGLNKASNSNKVLIKSEKNLLEYLQIMPVYHYLDQNEAIYEYNGGTTPLLSFNDMLTYGTETLLKILKKDNLFKNLSIIDEWTDNNDTYDENSEKVFHIFLNEIIKEL